MVLRATPLFTEVYNGSIITGKMRFVLPICLVVGAKILVAWSIYLLATSGGREFTTFWAKEWGIQDGPKWPLLFHGWDSAWYMRIAAEGYSYPAYAFLPAFPFLIRIANQITSEWLVASFVMSFSLGVMMTPVFQALMEHYVDRGKALVAAVFFSLFPPIFLFSSVAYTESLFSISILGAWIFSLKKRWVPAVSFSVVATLTKIHGLLIVLPVALCLLKKSGKAAVLSAMVPSLCFLAWNVYLFWIAGDLLALSSSQGYWLQGWPLEINSVIRSVVELSTNATESAHLSTLRLFVLVCLVLAIMGISGILLSTTAIDREFGLYAVVLFLFVVTFGTVWSFLRFVPFILPIWLSITRIRKTALVLAAIAFLVVNIEVWFRFVVIGMWIG